MKNGIKYTVSVKNNGDNVDIQKSLRDSETGTKTINLSGRNSIIKNSGGRRNIKITNIMKKIVSCLAVLALCAGIIGIVGETIHFEIEEVKAELLAEPVTKESLPTEIEVVVSKIEIPTTQIKEVVEKPVVNNNSKTDQEVIDIAMDFIVDFESMHMKSYWDVKRYSIGCGTISYKDEIITIEEAKNRCREYIGGKLVQINRLADGIAWNKKVALLSFMHNVGFKGDVLAYAARGDDASVIYLIGQYNMAGGKYMKGLAKRRGLEIEYYNN